uniref:ORF4 n=1 Tax=Andrena associated bee virus-1 TaxID=2811531 RepID=A0A897ZH96_9VIRU|nr:ORF4 [Andrena associated bee virus-1]
MMKKRKKAVFLSRVMINQTRYLVNSRMRENCLSMKRKENTMKSTNPDGVKTVDNVREYSCIVWRDERICSVVRNMD